MVQMGLRHPIPMRALLSLRWITLATGIGALALSLVVLDGIASLLGLTVGLVLCALVDLVVRVRATRRCARFEAELPDAIDLLTLAMDAGLSLDASLHRIAVDLAGRSKLLGKSAMF
ncbi:MAG: hypothetical protein EBX64_08570 [Betaproteobacteria bacterium]|nr:hypothetical protein [Betaproteobacteria bacterium]